MNKVIIVLGLFIFGSITHNIYKNRGKILNYPLTMNEVFDDDTTAKLWNDISRLHKRLPISETIVINMNSVGGLTIPSVVLFSRIAELKELGRKFAGTIYGVCFSACGTLFSLMDYKYMTANGLYMQHLSSQAKSHNSTHRSISKMLDAKRLIYDAAMMNLPYAIYYLMLHNFDIVLTSGQMFQYGLIDAIVPHPDLETI